MYIISCNRFNLLYLHSKVYEIFIGFTVIVCVYEEVNVPQNLCGYTAISHLICIGWKIKAALFEI